MLKHFLLLLEFNIKRIVKQLPVILSAGLIFFALSLLLCFGCIKYSSASGSDLQKNHIGVVINDSNSYTTVAVGFVSTLKGIKESCKINIVEEKRGLKQLEDNTIDALVYLPEGFLDSILTGGNIPAYVILSSDNINSGSEIIKTLINAGARDLAVAQIGIYSVDKLAAFLNLSDEYKTSVNYDTNSLFIDFVSNRNSIWKETDNAAKQQLNSTQFYICTVIVFMLLLLGVSCMSTLVRADSSTVAVFVLNHISIFFYPVIQILSHSALLTLLLLPVLVIAGLIDSLLKVFILILLIMSAISFSVFLYRLFNNEIVGMFVIYIVSIIGLYISGAFIPSALLPEQLILISRPLLVTAQLALTHALYTGGFEGGFLCMLYSFIFIILSGLLEMRLEKK